MQVSFPSDLDLLPRIVQRSTRLGDPSAPLPAVIHPADDAGFASLAARLAGAVEAQCGIRPECMADTAVLPTRDTRLPDACRARPLVLIGNLNNNRVFAPLYANLLCSTDAAYPGGDGFDLRTIVNPYGTGRNVIIAGGSSRRGIERAVERLIARIAGPGASVEIPFLLEVELDPALAANLAAWPYAPLDSDASKVSRTRGWIFYTDVIRALSAHALMWSLTGDERHAFAARDSLRALNGAVEDGYGDWHYLAERVMRAVPLLVGGGILDDADIARTDRLLLNTALGTQNDWWRMRHGKPPLGHRHHGKGTYEFLLLARYLRDQANPTPALRAFCDRWIAECHTFLDALAAARIDDQDDESTLNNLATLYRYALGEERHAFFTSGNARLVAERALALHDNNGAGAGQGGYGESLPGAMYYQQEATIQVACSAFYHGDGELKWILQRLPNLNVAQRCSFLQFPPAFLQKFDTGDELAPVQPARLRGIQCLPVTDHQYAINVSPPENVEFRGHMVNAPETWQLPEGVGLNRLPQERGFDKMVFRGGFAREDAYLLLQGYQGGYRWQGHMHAANCIVRFAQAGHIFLIQNTSRHSHYDKNGLFISDGANDAPMPPITERVAVADLAPLGMSVTRLADCHGGDWTRHIFWSRGDGDCFVVIDRAVFPRAGLFSLTCTWRTPGCARLEGRRWVADQGGHRFTLVSGSDLPMTSEEERDQGAAVPFVLRQRLAGSFSAGGEACFHNLFFVRPRASGEALDLLRIGDRGALLRRGRENAAWCGAALERATPWLPGAIARAESAWVEPAFIALAGARECAIGSTGWRFESDHPLSLLLDLAGGRATLALDTPGPAEVAVTVEIGAGSTPLLVREKAVTIALPADACARLSADVRGWLDSVPVAVAAAALDSTDWPEQGCTTEGVGGSGTPAPERLRDICVMADPSPVDGFPDQLIDTVLPEMRETWRQWPQADGYDIRLEVPEPRTITRVNLLGDCVEDPTLRTFQPLPEGITIEVHSGEDTPSRHEPVPGPDRFYKRYRDMENRLQVLSASIGRKASALSIRIPAPPAGRPLVLHEIEVFGDRLVAPAVERLMTADVNGDGRPEIIVVNAGHELLLLDERGNQLWRLQLPKSVTHLSCQVLQEGERPSICAAVLGGDLHIVDGDGATRGVWPVAADYARRHDAMFGWMSTINSLSLWHRDAQGRAWLAAGGYAVVVFLDPDGGIVGHSWADGSWITDLLLAPEGLPCQGDLFARCGWNHGVFHYEGFPGVAPSGETLGFGGVHQPMFRPLRRVIPFVNGRSLAFEWARVPSCPEGAIFAATALGCGLLGLRERDWRWKLEGGTCLQACVTGQVGDVPVALTGGADGMIVALELESGRVVRRKHMGAPVVGLAQPDRPRGSLVVATRAGVRVVDANWSPVGGRRGAFRRMLGLGGDRVAVVRDDGAIEVLAVSA